MKTEPVYTCDKPETQCSMSDSQPVVIINEPMIICLCHNKGDCEFKHHCLNKLLT